MLESKEMPLISAATEADIDGIESLLAPNVKKQLVLARSKEDILLHLGNFLLARDDGGRLVGCVALRGFGEGLYEIRSLSVDAAFMGRGIGTRLVEACVEKAAKMDGSLVFTLTLRPNLSCGLASRKSLSRRFIGMTNSVRRSGRTAGNARNSTPAMKSPW